MIRVGIKSINLIGGKKEKETRDGERKTEREEKAVPHSGIQPQTDGEKRSEGEKQGRERESSYKKMGGIGERKISGTDLVSQNPNELIPNVMYSVPAEYIILYLRNFAPIKRFFILMGWINIELSEISCPPILT